MSEATSLGGTFKLKQDCQLTNNNSTTQSCTCASTLWLWCSPVVVAGYDTKLSQIHCPDQDVDDGHGDTDDEDEDDTRTTEYSDVRQVLFLSSLMISYNIFGL